MMNTVTLTEFLLARITEDDASADELHWETCEHLAAREIGGFPCDCWYPGRVRAECEAKRRILEFHKSWPVLVQRQPTFELVDTGEQYRATFGDEPPTSPILRALALPYADHPDYREEWRL